MLLGVLCARALQGPLVLATSGILVILGKSIAWRAMVVNFSRQAREAGEESSWPQLANLLCSQK